MSDLAKCGACEAVMDVTAAAPYARVRCPGCDAEVRVKCDFGNYFLDRRHAFGGMSVVFVAVDNTLGREVALKVLNEEYSCDEVRAAKFEKEAELTALVSHPNVVRVYTVGRAHGRFYIAMELVQGESLEKRMESGKPLPEKEILAIALQVVEGLQAAKESGLIHRDIKPGNILVDEKGTVKIVDFGLSLVTQGGQAKADEVFATPYYVSPEALEAGEEDFRSDMYALGASLYHALAGKPPIATESTGTNTLREAKQRATSLKKAAPWLSDATVHAVDKAMAYRRENRFASYEEMKSALHDGLEDRPPAEGNPRAALRQRRRKAGMVFGVSLALLAALTGGLVFLASRAKDDNPTADAPKDESPALLPAESDEVKIGRLYQDARDLLGEGRFLAAEDAFGQLWRQDGVPEPTASWACFEAGVAAGLDGRSAEARAHFERLSVHLAQTEMDQPLREGFQSVQDDWQALGFAKLPEEVPSDKSEALFYFARALKNWEQGDRSAAEAFRKLAEAGGEGKESGSLGIYREWAGKLAADSGLLEKSEPDWSTNWDEEKVASEVARLDQLVKKLQTPGRARFTVRSWQTWLFGRGKELERAREAAGDEDGEQS